MALDVDERHLLRMGHGEEELETEKDYSRFVCDIVVFCVRYLTLVWYPLILTALSILFRLMKHL